MAGEVIRAETTPGAGRARAGSDGGLLPPYAVNDASA